MDSRGCAGFGIVYVVSSVAGGRFGTFGQSVISRSVDDGATWISASPGFRQGSYADAFVAAALDLSDGKTLYAANLKGVFKSTDGGDNWSAASAGLPWTVLSIVPQAPLLQVSALVVDPSRPNIVYAAFAHSGSNPDAGIYVSTDGGATWAPRNQGLTSLAITALALDRNDTSTLYAGTAADGVFVTTDGAQTWNQLGTLPAGDPRKIESLVVDPVTGRKVYAGTAGGAYALTLDPPPDYLPVIEYYAADFDHYFISSEAQSDIAALDSGAIPGWVRTRRTFRVYPLGAAGASTVCRFFSGQAFAPKSSHFYTPYENECAYLQQQGVWQYEGDVFAIGLPVGPAGQGVCPLGSAPLYRMYNNGQGGAPNHRYTDDLTIVAQMTGEGWIFEGEALTKVFACSPVMR